MANKKDEGKKDLAALAKRYAAQRKAVAARKKTEKKNAAAE